ncbi:MAG: iron ABC transporter permease [Asgard group archaeon]|nr:iron ABC transporter permease [Asgard group archaeon]
MSNQFPFRKKILKRIGLFIPIFLISIFILFPVISVLITGFSDETGFTLTYFIDVITNGEYYKLLAFTLSQALLSTLISVIIGLPIGYLFGKYKFPGSKVFLTFFTVPFVLPSVLVGMGFLVVFGENGLFGSAILSIIIAHAFYNIPLVVHYVSTHFQTTNPEVFEAAKTLGSDPKQKFLRIFFPIFLEPIVTASLLTFNFCFLSFGIILMLGGGKFLTLETEINSLFLESLQSQNIAAALAIFQLLITIGYLILYFIFLRKRSRVTTGETEKTPKKKITVKSLIQNFRTSQEKTANKRTNIKSKIKKLFTTKEFYFSIVFMIGLVIELIPLISTLIYSFWNPYQEVFTLSNYNVIFDLSINVDAYISIPRAILNTILFALGGALVASLLAIITVATLGKSRYEKKSIPYEIISFFPLSVSSITLALGILKLFFGFNLFQQQFWLFIIITHGLLGYPFVTRALMNGLNTISPEIIESARTLGSKPLFRFRKIYVPLLLPSFLTGFIFAFGMSLGEFATTNFFSYIEPSISTLTVVLFRLKRSRKFGQASAIGALLLMLSYLAFLLIEFISTQFMKRQQKGKKLEIYFER